MIALYKFWWGSDRGPASEQNSVVLQSAVSSGKRFPLAQVRIPYSQHLVFAVRPWAPAGSKSLALSKTQCRVAKLLNQLHRSLPNDPVELMYATKLCPVIQTFFPLMSTALSYFI